MMKKTHTILISDVHLGSEVSRAKRLVETLESWEFKKLILIGDIFDDLNFERLNEDHWIFLSHIREYSDPERAVEVVWIKGNHDELLAQVASSLLGVEVLESYEWEHAGARHLAIHGHQYDRFLVNNKFLSDVASGLYIFLQKIDMKKRRFSRFVKRMSKRWLRLSEKVSRSAIKFGKTRGARYVFCGHTHMALEKKTDSLSYFNIGCWTDIPSSFATIAEDGTVELHRVD